jgi:membrane protein DedA with SNARE-associated domain
MVSAAALPAALTAMPTVVAVAVLCVAVVTEIVVVPAVLLPGGTMTLLAGALIGAGRPPLEIAIPVSLAVIVGDQLAYSSGALVIGWWRRRRPGRAERAERAPLAARGRAAKWLAATMPSLAGAARMPYREFTARVFLMRLPWLTAALAGGALAADSLQAIGHVAGIAGPIVSVLVVAALYLMHRRPGALRVLLSPGRACGRRRG